MTEIMVPFYLNEEQMDRLKKITVKGISPVDMFIIIMQMESKGHIDRTLAVWEKMSEKSA